MLFGKILAAFLACLIDFTLGIDNRRQDQRNEQPCRNNEPGSQAVDGKKHRPSLNPLKKKHEYSPAHGQQPVPKSIFED